MELFVIQILCLKVGENGVNKKFKGNVIFIFVRIFLTVHKLNKIMLFK